MLDAAPVAIKERANALVAFTALEMPHPASAPRSSTGTAAMSRTEMDPPGSNLGPARVHLFACVLESWRRRYAQKPDVHVAHALGFAPGTVKKWFLGQREPGAEARLRIAAAYGEEPAVRAAFPREVAILAFERAAA
jgi:hypothetical protein